jgi:hypothetical protein
MPRLLLVGDVHANVAWFDMTVAPTAAAHHVDAVVALGDFGWWPHQPHLVDACGDLHAGHGIPTWFLDGNHEHHHDLARAVTAARSRLAITDPAAAVPLARGLVYLPRGHRFQVDDVTVAVLGGARSIDRALRRPGIDWFPEEAVTGHDLARLAAGGHADVLLTHDAPAGHQIPGIGPNVPPAWQSELPACDDHRRRISAAAEAVTPRWLFHGHYHVAYETALTGPWGPLNVTGLDRDGAPQAMALLAVQGATVTTTWV